MKKRRLNLDLTEDDLDELEKAKKLLGAGSLTETIRRSTRSINQLLELQGANGQIIIKRKNSQQSVVFIT